MNSLMFWTLIFSKAGTPCNNYAGYCDVFQKCREVDPAGKFTFKTIDYTPEVDLCMIFFVKSQGTMISKAGTPGYIMRRIPKTSRS